jgi:hypothetical protein
MASPTFDGNPIFIGGDGRSGTTLLSLVLDSHPDLIVGPELHFGGPDDLGPYALACCELLIAEDPRGFGQGLKENPQFKRGVQFVKRCHRFGVQFPELRDLITRQMDATGSKLSRFEDRCSLIDAIGEHRRAATSSARWGIKIMRDIGRADAFAKLWPRAQFIHIVRDGRDVAASQLIDHGKWGYDDVKRAAQGWVDLLKKVRKCARKASILEVRYEDLVAEPEATARRIVDFLGVSWHDNLLRHSEVDHSLYDNPYNHPSIRTVVKPINTSAVGRYRTELDAGQIESFDKIARAFLQEFRYTEA